MNPIHFLAVQNIKEIYCFEHVDYVLLVLARSSGTVIGVMKS